ncbi:MAG: [FeFe] hydrogenase H-cluster maturation GTPase HydF [Lachnospiraceae bacterium]|nr:[FeFe] hydrogenase H-cluster maturation GTPase HydF [Lachnospiraceae bacterium]
MSLNDTPMAERTHIGFFGLRNAGKSSLVNRITAQEMSLVSDVLGTTTDPVKKSMELLPLGPVTIIDTPGYDDEGALGEKRVARTKEILATCDIAVLVTESDGLSAIEAELFDTIKKREIPYLIVRNKADLAAPAVMENDTAAKDMTAKDMAARDKAAKDMAAPPVLLVSAQTGEGIEALKEALARCAKGREKQIRLVADMLKPSQVVILVIPIDTSAPKGRLILPQQEALRDILDAGAIGIVSSVEGLSDTISRLKEPPSLVITDSQAFGKVMHIVPETIPLTSFSILMARYKGFLKAAMEGASAIDRLPDHAKVLIAEGCTHHRQCEDIGTVKLPRWLSEYTGKEMDLTFTSGHGFPEDLSAYDLVIHCGACMLHDNEMANRMRMANEAGVPFTNYGTAIAHMNGILARSTAYVLPYLD